MRTKTIKKTFLLTSIFIFSLLAATITYASTSSQQTEAVKAISDAIISGKTSVDLTKYDLDRTELRKVSSLAYDNSLLYVEARDYKGIKTYAVSNGTVTTLPLVYGATGSQYQARLNTLNAKISEVKKNVTSSMSQAEKALVAHDYLVTNTSYDYDNYMKFIKGQGSVPYASYTAYGALVNHKAVCEGYSKAYIILLNSLGIESKIVSSDEMMHEWNAVKVDGAWYHVDVTWDDPVWSDKEINRTNYVTHKYFLKNDREMKGLGHSSWETLVSSTSTKYSKWVFSNSETKLGYIGGYWYATSNGSVIKAKFNGSSKSTVASSASYIGIIKDRVYYYSTTSKNFWSCKSTGSDKKVDKTVSLSYPKYSQIKYSEVTASGTINAVVLDYQGTTKLTPIYRKVTYKPSVAVHTQVYVSKPSLYSLKSSKKITTIKWKKNSSNSGYEVYRSTKKSSGFKKVATVSGSSKTYTKNKVSKKGTYYYKVRAYKVVSGKKYYSSYSSVKVVKVK